MQTTPHSKTVCLATGCNECRTMRKVLPPTDIIKMGKATSAITEQTLAASRAMGAAWATLASPRLTSCRTITASTRQIAFPVRMHTPCKTPVDLQWNPALRTGNVILHLIRMLDLTMAHKTPITTKTMQCQCTATTPSSSASRTTT